MNKAEQILNELINTNDLTMICEFWAVNIDFHENKTEYFFSDESSLVVEA